ncbi:MAG: hypothetical protein U1E36_04220 [Rickettsiales bacterium]
MQLLAARTSNGSASAIDNTSFLQSIYCWGTFDGCTVTLEGSPNNTDWFTLTSFTAKGVKCIGVNARFLAARYPAQALRPASI